MIGVSPSTSWCGGNHRASRAFSRDSRSSPLARPLTVVNSSAQSPSSDDSASMSPSGVGRMVRKSCIRDWGLGTGDWGLVPSNSSQPLLLLHQVADQCGLFLDQLLDPVVGQIEQA